MLGPVAEVMGEGRELFAEGFDGFGVFVEEDLWRVSEKDGKGSEEGQQ